MSALEPRTIPRVLGISSSPRLKNSSAIFDSLSNIMLQGILENIQELSGAHSETIHLSQLNIHPCRRCFSDMETRCHFLCDCCDHDFKMVAEKMMAADAIILGTPTYMFGMSSVLKRFLERCVSFKAPPIDRDATDKSLDECFDLLHMLRQFYLMGQEVKPSMEWIIKRLIKVGARVSDHGRRWQEAMASAFPSARHYRAVFG